MPSTKRPPSVFSGPERWRLLTGVMMLIVLAMLISRVGDPSSWRWLSGSAGVSPAKQPAGGGGLQSCTKQEDRHSCLSKIASLTHKMTDRNVCPPDNAVPLPALQLPPATGPTEEDAKEAIAARKELAAVSDGELVLGPEEMDAYDRLVSWVQHQSFARLWRRATKNLAYTYLYDSPAKRRGKLIAIDVDIRLVRNAGETRRGVPVYEAWASSENSGNRLYNLILVDCPKSLPLDKFIREKAKFAGYFLKVKAYEAGDAKPGQKPERAPLLIGRLERSPGAGSLVNNTGEWGWSIAIIAIVAIVLVARWTFFRPKRPGPPTPDRIVAPSGEVIPIDVWLEQGNLSNE